MKRFEFFPLVALVATVGGALGVANVYAGDSGAIEGTIIDQQTSQVVGGGRLSVAVTCGNVRKSAAVDGSGHFSIGDLPDGACTLTITGAAYVSTAVAVTVTGGSIATILVNVTTKAYVAQQQAAQAAEMRRYRGMRKEIQYDFAGGDMMMEGEGRGGGGGGPPRMMPPPAPAPMAAPPKPSPTPKHEAMRATATGTTAVATTKHVKQMTDATVMRAPATPAAVAANAPPPPPMGAMVVAKLARDDKNADRQLHANRQMAAHHNGMGNMPIQQAAGGWAPVRVFPVPSYTKAYDGPRTDFRETIFWNPSVETNANGDAEVAFVASDAVTSFRATAEGFAPNGTAGTGTATFQSKLPLTLDAHLPVEVTSGDTIQLPITLANETDQPLDATLASTFGAAFKLAKDPTAGVIHLKPHEKESLFFPLEVVATSGDANVDLKLTSRGLTDELHKTIRVVPRGFPIEASASGTARGGQAAAHVLDLAGALAGSIHASVTMYPSPVAAMTEGMAAMIREPGGCFEQASSTNYPNIMILSYLNSSKDADPTLVAKTQTVLDHGYKLLTGYETPEKGYEWFGHTPGHEALTAYGLMEFAEMGKVYDVDHKMVERTADWLMTRRDQQGGFLRSPQAVDSFGRASPATTNAYIMWALSEAKRTGGMSKEVAAQQTLGGATSDPYLLSLAASTSLTAAPKSGDSAAMVKRLAGMQGKDGSFTGARETITMSGGDSLNIETTALATLALIKASPNNEYEAQIRAAAEWLNGKRSGGGSWGNTQATILGLKALTAYTEHARQMAAGGKATLVINGKDAGTIEFDKGHRDALVWNDLDGKLAAGKNTIEIRLDSAASLPYTITVDYRSAQPATSPRSKIAVGTQLIKTQTKMGDGVTLRAHIENTTHGDVPMTLARIGLPGGTVFQTWQLKELRDKGIIDFYETRPREVILYWRALAADAKKDVDLNLLSAVPGTYEAPASSAYLYYTAEDKSWSKPVAITIDK